MSEVRGFASPPIPGCVIWITGFAGAGKSTVADLVVDALGQVRRRPILLDGDVLRQVMGATDGAYGPADRLRLAGVYSRLCAELARQGFDVVCATVSMFEVVRAWNRQNLAQYFEVYLRVSHEELRQRDKRGLYSAHERGTQAQVSGLDLAAEEPSNPDMIVDNQGVWSPSKTAAAIVAAVIERLR